MRPRTGTLYTIGFAAAVCVVCAILVSAAAVGLSERQERNRALDRKLNVLVAAGLVAAGEERAPERIEELFTARVRTVLIDRATGRPAAGVDPESHDQRRAAQDPAESDEVPQNPAKVQRVPRRLPAYEVGGDGGLDLVVLPVEGKGLWSTLYGYLALDADATTVRGLAFYRHGETPGLGGEIENPAWLARWPGRRLFDAAGTPALAVIKGRAGAPEADPHRVDGLSGATLTGNGVTALIRFWAGEHGFGPYLARLREGGPRR
jgi:Na+-transporting NADH:ubiquinone oxidoreductase subunit C